MRKLTDCSVQELTIIYNDSLVFTYLKTDGTTGYAVFGSSKIKDIPYSYVCDIMTSYCYWLTNITDEDFDDIDSLDSFILYIKTHNV